MNEEHLAAVVAGIAQLTQLQRLDLRIRRSFPVEPLLSLPNLGELIMPQMTAAQVEPLRIMPSLRSLTLHGGKNNLSAEDVDVLTAFTRRPHQLQLTTFSLGGVVCTEAIASMLSQVSSITDGRWCGVIAGSNLDFLLSWAQLTSLHLSFTDPARVSADVLAAAVSQCKLVTQFGTMHREMSHAHFVQLLDARPALIACFIIRCADFVLLFQQAKFDRLTALAFGSTMWKSLVANPELLRPSRSLRKLDLSWIQPKADEIAVLEPPSLILPKLHTLVLH